MTDTPRRIVFVTGASGFIGRHVCRRLVDDGHTVRAMVRRPDAQLERLGVALSFGDLWDRDVLVRAIGEADVVIHCAGDPTFGNGPRFHRANVELTEHLIGVVRERRPNLERFVFVSTIGAVDRQPADDCALPLTEDAVPAPSSDYGRSKLEAEEVVRRSGLNFAIVRPTMVVGADMRPGSHFAAFARHALSRSLVGRVAWPGCFSVVHVDDLAEALRLVATHPDAAGRTYFCAGESISLARHFDLAAPNASRLPFAWAAGLASPFRRWTPFAIKALLRPALTASDAALRALGWRPTHDAASALRDVIARERARLDPRVDPGGQTVITGAASGLGRALAEALAPIRQRLLLIDRDREGLQAVASRLPNARAVRVDLASASERDTLVRGDEWNAHSVTELFACAGVGARAKVQDTPLATHRDMFEVNVLSRLALGLDAVAAMQRAHFGRVVLVSSSSAFQPLPHMATYAATNSALLSLGQAWAQETAADGVHVMTVCPGGMRTNFQGSAGVREVPGEKLMSPNDVAGEILRGLAKGKAVLVVSFRSFAMSLLARLLPRRLSVALWARLMARMR